MCFYAGFSKICEGVAEFQTLEAMQAWLNRKTDIDRFLDASGEKWDAPMGARISFTPEQVNELFGGSLKNALYSQPEPATGEKILWYYMPL